MKNTLLRLGLVLLVSLVAFCPLVSAHESGPPPDIGFCLQTQEATIAPIFDLRPSQICESDIIAVPLAPDVGTLKLFTLIGIHPSTGQIATTLPPMNSRRLWCQSERQHKNIALKAPRYSAELQGIDLDRSCAVAQNFYSTDEIWCKPKGQIVYPAYGLRFSC